MTALRRQYTSRPYYGIYPEANHSARSTYSISCTIRLLIQEAENETSEMKDGANEICRLFNEGL